MLSYEQLGGWEQATDSYLLEMKDTLPKFNIAPEKLPSQKESNLPTIIFQGRTVKLHGCIEKASIF